MKRIILILTLLGGAVLAYGENVFVTNDSTHAIPVTASVTASQAGATNAANSQVATSTTAGTLAIARATRRFCTIRNMDATISVYVGAATVTAGNGFLLKANESMNFYGVGLIQVIAASGTPTVAIYDYYD